MVETGASNWESIISFPTKKPHDMSLYDSLRFKSYTHVPFVVILKTADSSVIYYDEQSMVEKPWPPSQGIIAGIKSGKHAGNPLSLFKKRS